MTAIWFRNLTCIDVMQYFISELFRLNLMQMINYDSIVTLFILQRTEKR